MTAPENRAASSPPPSSSNRYKPLGHFVDASAFDIVSQPAAPSFPCSPRPPSSSSFGPVHSSSPSTASSSSSGPWAAPSTLCPHYLLQLRPRSLAPLHLLWDGLAPWLIKEGPTDDIELDDAPAPAPRTSPSPSPMPSPTPETGYVFAVGPL